MNNQEYCPWCSAPVKKRLECDCRESQRNRKFFSKKVSSRVQTHKSFGQCPKCRALITEMDINKYLQVVCPSCGTMEEYQKVKEGAWKS